MVAGKPRGHCGGRPITVVGAPRYQEMSRQLHRHRRGVFDDRNLAIADRKAIVEALDRVLDLIQTLC